MLFIPQTILNLILAGMTFRLKKGTDTGTRRSFALLSDFTLDDNWGLTSPMLLKRNTNTIGSSVLPYSCIRYLLGWGLVK